jgi:hypothetical protein
MPRPCTHPLDPRAAHQCPLDPALLPPVPYEDRCYADRWCLTEDGGWRREPSLVHPAYRALLAHMLPEWHGYASGCRRVEPHPAAP